MAARLTPAEREEYAPLAYQLSLQRLCAPEIARALSLRAGHDISEKAVDRLIKSERAKVAARRTEEGWDDLDQFLAEQELAMAESAARATSEKTSASAAAAHLANYIAASKNKATALGLFARKHEDLRDVPETVTIKIDSGNRVLPPRQDRGSSAPELVRSSNSSLSLSGVLTCARRRNG